jgi:hypothetical protein
MGLLYNAPEVPKGPIKIAGPVGVIISLISFILQLLGISSANTGALVKGINTTWVNLSLSASFLYNSVSAITDFLKRFVLILIDGLKHIISDILHGHLLQLIKDVQTMFHALHALFKPIFDALQWLHDHFYKYVYPWIIKVQDLLSRIRVILSAFRILGFKWAAKLDADIARIQGYLTTALQDIVKTLNTVTTWINLAVDPAGVLRGSFFTGTLFSSLGSVKSAVNFGQDRPLFASEQQATDEDKAMMHGGAAILTRNADGSVAYSNASKRINDNLDAAWDSYGPPGRKH